MTTMVLGGLWHGANWTFVLWGVYHGVLVALQRFLEEHSGSAKRLFAKNSGISCVVSAVVTFHLICLGWILFRSESVSHTIIILKTITGGAFIGHSFELPIVLMLGVATVSHILRSKWNMEEWYVRLPAPVQGFGYACVTILIYLFFTSEQRFIYFQF
jgi:alginate O-acetyltransferase complex protein AlgI